MQAVIVPLFPQPADRSERLDALAPRRAASIDRRARVVRDARGAEIALTCTEFDLLTFLLDHRGVALTRDAILDAVWGPDVVVTPRTVDNFVASLRRKLGWNADADYRIRTLRGHGYRLDVREAWGPQPPP